MAKLVRLRMNRTLVIDPDARGALEVDAEALRVMAEGPDPVVYWDVWEHPEAGGEASGG